MLYFRYSCISDHIPIDNYYYLLLLRKTKRYNIKWKLINFKKSIKNGTCCYFDDIIKLEDFDLDNILIDQKPHENILIYGISYKTLFDPKPLLNKFRWIY